MSQNEKETINVLKIRDDAISLRFKKIAGTSTVRMDFKLLGKLQENAESKNWEAALSLD